jgi:hypothetical protein
LPAPCARQSSAPLHPSPLTDTLFTPHLSPQLRKAVEAILAQPGAVRPEKVRFFRGQMQNIISKAVSDLGAKPVPSRRCFSVMSWLEQRSAEVYPADPRYNEKAASLFMLDLGPPEVRGRERQQDA